MSDAMCPNGPDEYGNWPCDPDPHGDGTATCSVCGFRARWLPICEHQIADVVGHQGAAEIRECRRCGDTALARLDSGATEEDA